MRQILHFQLCDRPTIAKLPAVCFASQFGSCVSSVQNLHPVQSISFRDILGSGFTLFFLDEASLQNPRATSRGLGWSGGRQAVRSCGFGPTCQGLPLMLKRLKEFGGGFNQSSTHVGGLDGVNGNPPKSDKSRRRETQLPALLH